MARAVPASRYLGRGRHGAPAHPGRPRSTRCLATDAALQPGVVALPARRSTVSALAARHGAAAERARARRANRPSPALGLRTVKAASRPALSLATTIRLHSPSHPLRLDIAAAVAAALVQTAAALRGDEAAVVQWVIGPSTSRRQPIEEFVLSEALGFQAPRPLSPGDTQAWKAKIAEPLFGIYGRLGAQTTHPGRGKDLLARLHAALALAESPQTKLVVGRPSVATARQVATVMGRQRRWSSVVNAAELAMLIGWPIDSIAVPGRPRSRLAPAPRQLLLPVKASEPTTRILGRSLHPADGHKRVVMPAAACWSSSPRAT